MSSFILYLELRHSSVIFNAEGSVYCTLVLYCTLPWTLYTVLQYCTLHYNGSCTIYYRTIRYTTVEKVHYTVLYTTVDSVLYKLYCTIHHAALLLSQFSLISAAFKFALRVASIVLNSLLVWCTVV